MGYTPPDSIDIGSAAINRVSSTSATNTKVEYANPANFSGKIKSIELWAETNLSNCEVATFFVVSGNNLSTRDTHTIGSVTAGSKQTFEVDLDVEAGDYIGIYYTAGTLERDISGAGNWYQSGDNIPCTNVSFSFGTDTTMSIYGTGDTGLGYLTIGEAFSIVDSLVKNVIKALSEAFSIVDSWVARISFSEAFSVADSLVKSATKQLTETLLVVDSKVTKIVRYFLETLSVVDSFRRFFYNLYSKISKSIATYTKKDKGTSTYTKTDKSIATYTKKDKEKGEE